MLSHIYSFNQKSNPLAFPPPFLSNGYIIATSGATSVKIAIFNILLKYINVNLKVNVINAIYMITYPN